MSLNHSVTPAIGKSPKDFWTESDNIAIGQDASNILSYMKHMFDGVDQEAMKAIVQSIGKLGGLSEENLVKALIEQAASAGTSEP